MAQEDQFPRGVKFLYFKSPAMGALKRAFGPHLEKVFGPGSRGHGGVVTVAWISPGLGLLHVAFSFCSPSDPWCRATGRTLAAERLRTHYLAIPYLYDARGTIHQVLRAVLNHDWPSLFRIADYCEHDLRPFQNSVPGWTKGLVKRVQAGERMWGRVSLWERMKKTLQKDIQIPKPTAAQILARMKADIAKLEK